MKYSIVTRIYTEILINQAVDNFTSSRFRESRSYGWGDGEWMRNWEETCQSDGAVLVCESVICNNTPDDEAAENCRALGAALTV